MASLPPHGPAASDRGPASADSCSPLPASSPYPKYAGRGYSNSYLIYGLSVQVIPLKDLMNTSFVCFALKVLPKLDYRRNT
ncbi:unnamed protein product [Coccothraustes coccothraustes]